MFGGDPVTGRPALTLLLTGAPNSPPLGVTTRNPWLHSAEGGRHGQCPAGERRELIRQCEAVGGLSFPLELPWRRPQVTASFLETSDSLLRFGGPPSTGSMLT